MIVDFSENKNFKFSSVNDLGQLTKINNSMSQHIDSVLSLNLVNSDNIKSRKLKVVVDAVNSSGGIIVQNF